MQKQELNNKIEIVAECMKTLSSRGDIIETCPVSNIDIDKWEWPQGIGMYGLYKYYELSKEEKTLKWLLSWYDSHIEKGLPDKNINTTAPLLALTYLYKYSPKQEYLDIFSEWAEYIMNEFDRTEEDGFQHSGSGINDLYGQLWDDTLIMTCMFLGRAGELLGKKEYVAECERQFLLHAKYLCDRNTGLWYHGWSFNGRHNFGKGLWGRGNCWITVAIADLLEFESVSLSTKLFLKETLLSQVKALAELQTDEGMWRTLLNDETSYVESSATAGIGYGILKAVRTGWLPKEYKVHGIKAVEAINARIADDGAVGDVSYGTNVGMTAEDYKNIPICIMPYGQALAILLLAEAGMQD